MKHKKVFSIILIIALVTAAGITAVLYFSSKNNQDIKVVATVSVSDLELEKQLITLISHRGVTTDAPENTLKSVALAGEKGYKAVEFDIRQTADGVWVLSHDDRINRMTNGRGKISKLTYREILEFSVDNGNGAEESESIKIPTLTQAIDVCLTNSIKPYIEVKSYNEGGIETLFELLRDESVLESVAVISFDKNVVSEFNERSPKTDVWLLTSRLDNDSVELAKNNPKIGLSFNGYHRKNTAEIITELINDKIKLCAWTIDDKATFEKLVDIGITTFTTNAFTP